MISAADLYPEFIGVDPAPKAKALLASDAPTGASTISARIIAADETKEKNQTQGPPTAGRSARTSAVGQYVRAPTPTPAPDPATSSPVFSRGTEAPIPGQSETAMDKVMKEANRIDGLRLGYPRAPGGGSSGGERSNKPKAGDLLDCSGAVSALLRAGGWYSDGQSDDSGGMMDIGKSGPGVFTIYANEGHVYAVLNGKAWGTGGGKDYAGWISGYTSRPGFTVRHMPDTGSSTVTPTSGGSSGASGGGGGGVDARSMQTVSTAAAFGLVLEGPSIEDRFLSQNLSGQKSYMNDKPLIEFIDQLCTASMRHYQSLPDGRFYAFFPDYFGGFNHRAPYWEIDDIEIIDMTVYLSDTDLKTHVYVVGDTMPVGSAEGPIDWNKIRSSGVISIFEAFNLNWLGTSKGDKVKLFSDATKFMERYGVRPHYEKSASIHAPYFELFYAFQKFLFLWSRQFLTSCDFTFMPEIYPGGRVSIKDRGLICYVDSVKHEFDYESGFTTTAQLSAPSADVNSEVDYAFGMVRTSTGGSS